MSDRGAGMIIPESSVNANTPLDQQGSNWVAVLFLA